jgi:copper chaperone CopZ
MEKIAIQNLKCHGCGVTIKSGLEEIEGLHDIEIDVENKQVFYESDSKASTIVLKNKLIQLGYPPVGDPNGFGTKAKSYVSCAMGKIA